MGESLTLKCPHCKGTGELHASDVHFGLLLRINRDAKGWTQERLAEAVGRSRAQIANLEGGRGDVPLQLVLKIADALEISAKDLVP